MEQTILKYHGRGDHLKLVKFTDEKNNRSIYKVELNRKIVWAGEWLKTATIKFRAKAWELMSQEELPGLTEAANAANKENPITWNAI